MKGLRALTSLMAKAHNTLDPKLEGEVVRDIFKHGPSPELQAEWDRLEALEDEFWAAGPVRQQEMLRYHPELADQVLCEACKQVLPARWPAKVEEPS